MQVTTDAELDALREIGRIVALTLHKMSRAMEVGMTTAELDLIGAAILEQEGALSAPKSSYNFPGHTCISINEEAAHGIPGFRTLQEGDMVNIDVSASKNGFFADTGASIILGQGRPILEKLCQDGRTALEIGLHEARAKAPLAKIGNAIGKFATERNYTLIRNLASHGLGRALHEHPREIPTWPTLTDHRVLQKGQVITIEPFLSLGGTWAELGKDGWTLYTAPSAPVVQYEHSIVVTEDQPIILTLPPLD